MSADRERLEHGPLADQRDPAELLERETAFHGKVWDIVRDRVRLPGAEFAREYMSHSGAVAVIARDDAGRVLLINQYRQPIQTRDWEIPAGLLDVPGEDPLDAAKRELAEEADLEAEHWELLLSFHTTPGGSDEVIHLFEARGLRERDAFDRTDEEAEIVRRWVPLDEVVDAILDGRVHNGTMIEAVLAATVRDGRARA